MSFGIILINGVRGEMLKVLMILKIMFVSLMKFLRNY